MTNDPALPSRESGVTGEFRPYTAGVSDVDELQERAVKVRARSSPWRRFKRRWRRRLKRHRKLAAGVILAALTVSIVTVTLVAWDDEPPVSSGIGDHGWQPLPIEDFSHLGGGATIASVRGLVTSDKPLVLSVLGDSTGNAPDEWVYLWALHLAETRAVTYHVWDDVAQQYAPPVVLSTEGPATEIWNGSAPGRNAAYPSTLLRTMQPVEPDVVIYNFGHNDTAVSIDRGLVATMKAVEKRWGEPVQSVAMLQNPQRGATASKHAQTVADLRTAIAPALGLPTVDVWSAFEKDGRSLTKLISNADGYGVHPTPAGSQVWVDAVEKALG